jgi:RNA polymerase sigma factor (sigma-70 family)
VVEQRTLQGDDAQLFSVFHAELQRTVRRVVNTSAANIEDACADAWLALLRYDPDRRPTIRGWLVVVAIREAIRRDRLDRRHRPFIEDLDDDRTGVLAETVAALATSDDVKFDAHEALERLVEMKARHRRAFVLHVAGYSYDEIAEFIGVTRTAVDRYLRRARSHVRGTSCTPKRGPRNRKLASATAG